MTRLIALLFITLFSPLFIVIYLLLLFFYGRPVFFRQQRVGLNGSIFTLFKFRSMSKSSPGFNVIPAHVHFIGHILRLTKLDEL